MIDSMVFFLLLFKINGKIIYNTKTYVLIMYFINPSVIYVILYGKEESIYINIQNIQLSIQIRLHIKKKNENTISAEYLYIGIEIYIFLY